MSARRAAVIASWLTCIALATIVVAHARYITDLSAFLPAKPTPMQRLLVDQLREGPFSRLILVALEHGDIKTRAATLHRDGAPPAPRPRVLEHQQRRADHRGARPRLSVPAPLPVERSRHRRTLFCRRALRSAIGETIEELASPEGLFLKSLVPHDPTGEMLQIIDQLARTARTANPRRRLGLGRRRAHAAGRADRRGRLRYRCAGACARVRSAPRSRKRPARLRHPRRATCN